MRVYCCQLDIAWENPAANCDKVRVMLTAARPQASSLVILPEMFATGFSMNVAAVTDEPAGHTQIFLRQLASELGVTLMAGVVTGDTTVGGCNEAAIYHPDGSQPVRYRKLHPFSYARETEHYRPGQTVDLFSWGSFNVAPFICYDLRFPEAFRAAVRRGAQLMTVIANWPAARESHWLALLRARAIENQAYVVGVNRVGNDPNASYSGRSQIIDPRGEIIADAGDAETVISAEIDFDAMAKYRKDFSALDDMRLEFF